MGTKESRFTLGTRDMNFWNALPNRAALRLLGLARIIHSIGDIAVFARRKRRLRVRLRRFRGKFPEMENFAVGRLAEIPAGPLFCVISTWLARTLALCRAAPVVQRFDRSG